MNRPTNKEQEHDWIERYLTGQMLPVERAVVEKIMQTDADFNQEVALLNRAHKLMQEAFLEQQAIATIKELQARNRQRTQRIRLVKRSVGSLMAVGLLVVAYLSLTPVALPDSGNDLTVTRSLADDSVSMHNLAFTQFIEGQSHLMNGQVALAVKNFEKVATTSDIRPYFREAAQWHLAVAYLKSGQPEKAERMYDQLARCIDCEYSVGFTSRWQLWWQIKWAQLLS